ncbi:alanine dehydrogenase [Peptoniphilus sp. oral taxon 386]|uniref:alanine dehydrogenase n=1 Tax=Peptoniphilus sp. oral taxon 386 TaxID=652713 RepID=UPI0001DA9A9D|nr:alanine dehydrogenase [Peptoniphilus sp. oral taxon 386]EFI41975.1 alanine dehydrogenase [Peptoniphilus sp. oral taxon 386 str. F0131]
MIIGVLKEIKEQESRVSCTPYSVNELIKSGHKVYLEKDAGLASGFSNEDYERNGAIVFDTAEEVWTKSEMIYKVKEPIECEFKYLREGLIIYSYLHLAADEKLANELLKKKCISIAFETIQIGKLLPLLKPMSEVAGRMAVQEGAKFLTKPQGGKGVLLQGVPGVVPAHVVIIGAGVVGTAATRMAVGMGARVTVIDIDVERLGVLCDIFGGVIETLYSTPHNIASAVKSADMVISTILIPGRKAPKLVTEEMVKTMEAGSVIVDVAIDQGGSTETTAGRATTHNNPTFVKHGVIHYAVTNIPGAVARTSTYALSNATTKYAKIIADLGWVKAVKKHDDIKKGINTYDGKITYKAVAESLNREYSDILDLI